MKKIMFNDEYGLTKAVLEGRKTMTRRMAYNSDTKNPCTEWRRLTPYQRMQAQNKDIRIAAIREKRNFIGFELNKEYYDKACKRIKLEQAQLTLF